MASSKGLGPVILIFSCLSVLFFCSTAYAKSPYIGNLSVINSAKGLSINATLINGFTRKVAEAVQSGAPITIQYDIELKKRNAVLADENIVKRVIQRAVVYNSLKKQYKLSNILGTNKKTVALKKIKDVRNKMVQLRDIHIIPTKYLKPNEEYYIRVKGEMVAKSFWFPFNYILFFVDFLNFDTDWAESTSIVVNQFPVSEKPLESDQTQEEP